MNRHSTMTMSHVWPHPFLDLEKSLSAHAAFFESVYETLLAVVIIILTIAL